MVSTILIYTCQNIRLVNINEFMNNDLKIYYYDGEKNENYN